MRNVIKVFVLVDANERCCEVPYIIKCTRACHRDVSKPNFSFPTVSKFETFLNKYKNSPITFVRFWNVTQYAFTNLLHT